MVQHPVIEGLEPDADILSIHLALSNALATPEYCVKDQTRYISRDIPALFRTCDFAKRSGPAPRRRPVPRRPKLGRYVRSSREPRLTSGHPSVTAGPTEARWILWTAAVVKRVRRRSRRLSALGGGWPKLTAELT